MAIIMHCDRCLKPMGEESVLGGFVSGSARVAFAPRKDAPSEISVDLCDLCVGVIYEAVKKQLDNNSTNP